MRQRRSSASSQTEFAGGAHAAPLREPLYGSWAGLSVGRSLIGKSDGTYNRAGLTSAAAGPYLTQFAPAPRGGATCKRDMGGRIMWRP